MIQTAYRPDKFSVAFDHLQGARLWRWLHHPRQVEVMQTAAYLGRPPVEALSPHLSRDFAHVMGSVTARRMVGHMVCQVMECAGFHVLRANVRIKTPGNLFRFGTSYRPSS
ncbi:MAG: hypothetical protein AAF631_09710 [Pseudomonadota bacterium]